MKDLKPTLNKKGEIVSSGIVRRRTSQPYSHRGKKLIITLYPGDVVGIREERCRKEETAPIGRIYQQMIVWRLETERRERRGSKRRMR